MCVDVLCFYGNMYTTSRNRSINDSGLINYFRKCAVGYYYIYTLKIKTIWWKNCSTNKHKIIHENSIWTSLYSTTKSVNQCFGTQPKKWWVRFSWAFSVKPSENIKQLHQVRTKLLKTLWKLLFENFQCLNIHALKTIRLQQIPVLNTLVYLDNYEFKKKTNHKSQTRINQQI